MVKRVIKRDGRKVKFSERRLQEAISLAMRETGESRYGNMSEIVRSVVYAIDINFEDEITVENIQETICEVLSEMGLEKTAIAFCEYRMGRDNIRNKKSDIMKAIETIGKETGRDNGNVGNNYSAKLLQIASVANKWYNLSVMPKGQAKSHENGDYHIHDLDSHNLTINCLQIDLKELLEKGFDTGYGYINRPKRIESAVALACIILQSSQNDMFGGQSFYNFDNDMAQTAVKWVREKYAQGEAFSEDEIQEIIEASVHQSMQALCFNLNTMHSRAGSQVPFSGINIGIPDPNASAQEQEDAAMICRIFLEEYNEGMGHGEQFIFPNIVFRTKKGVNFNEDDKFYKLRLLAEKVAARRMNPTFRNLDNSVNIRWYEIGILAATMGCRTDVMDNVNGKKGPAKRGNIAPITMNIPRIALESGKNWTKFFKILDSRMLECKEQLMYRFGVLKNLKVRDLPFSAGQGLLMGSEDLGPDDSIEPILINGTWGIGFIGIAETLVAMGLPHHGDIENGGKSREYAFEIVAYMRSKIEDFKQETNLNFSLYATPAESVSGRFPAKDRKKFGIIEGVTDREFYTNSYHVPVYHNISISDKADIEAPFHSLCNAGKISYFEIDGGSDEDRFNLVHRTNNYVVNNTDIDYYGFNFHIMICNNCKANHVDKIGKCQCGSISFKGISRITGYLAFDERFGPSKDAERKSRVKHS
ncbi:MAG: anaerobic ribonucleoside-triphosphate reductase [Anaerovoracaceae bacterium]